MTRPQAHHSPDRRWWWDGSQWVPAYSADGRLLFNGSYWTPVAASRRSIMDWPRRLVAAVAAWSVTLSVTPAMTVCIAKQGEELPDDTLVRLAGIAALCLLTSLAVGFLFGLERRWKQLLLVAGVGTAVLAAWYVVSMVMFSPAADTSSDDAAGAGVVILGLPAYCVLLALLALGAAGSEVRVRLSQRRQIQHG